MPTIERTFVIVKMFCVMTPYFIPRELINVKRQQITRAQIRAMIENNEMLSTIHREMALIDFDEALNFYRGNTLIDTLGSTLGITSEQLDKFFETNDYKALMSDTFNLEE